MEKARVTIDGIEYSLTSENVEILNEAVVIVDEEIKNTKTRYKNKLNNETMMVLSSLNIAEKLIAQNIEMSTNDEKINEKLNDLVQQLENILN